MPLVHPVKYPVRSTSPVRIAGSTDAPFRVINLSPVPTSGQMGAIWVSDNPGLRPKFGTPIYAGTSLSWIKPTELWAICEPGDTGCELLVTSEIDDWQGDPIALAASIAFQMVNTGTILIDNPVTLFSGNLTAANSRVTNWFDIRRYQSLSIELVEIAAGSSVIDAALLEFSNDGVNVSLSKTIETFDVSPAIGSTWRASVPCNGAYVRVRSNISNTNYRLTLVGSYRPKSNIEQSMIDYNGGLVPEFIHEYYPTFGASSGVIYYFGPWFGEIELIGSFVIGTAPTAGQIQCFVARRNPTSGTFAAATRRIGISQVPLGATTVYQFSDRFASSGAIWSFTFTNNTAVAMSGLMVRINPISGFGAVS